MTTPTFTAPPTAPSRSMASAAFVAAANAFVAWFATLYAELTAGVSWFNSTAGDVASDASDAAGARAAAEAAADAAVAAVTLCATSTATLTKATGSTGSFSFAETGRVFALNDQVTLIDRTSATSRLRGTVTAVDNTARTMTVNVAKVVGQAGGSSSAWVVLHAALEATSPDDTVALAAAFAAAL